MDNLKYSARDLKGDAVAGGFNGAVFGLVYSFYFLPVDRLDSRVWGRCRSNPWVYFGLNSLKMAAGFAIMRSTYNCVKK
jgi:hypothetical protein